MPFIIAVFLAVSFFSFFGNSSAWTEFHAACYSTILSLGTIDTARHLPRSTGAGDTSLIFIHSSAYACARKPWTNTWAIRMTPNPILGFQDATTRACPTGNWWGELAPNMKGPSSCYK